MPYKIKYASLVNRAAGVSTGVSVAATSSAYTCPAGYVFSRAQPQRPSIPAKRRRYPKFGHWHTIQYRPGHQ
jgi:hypothetical protein